MKAPVISGLKCGQSLQTVSIDCPIGRLALTVCSNGLHRLSRLDDSFEPNPRMKVQFNDQILTKNEWIDKSMQWLKNYFESPDRQTGAETPPFCQFDTNSEFYQKVWSTLMNDITFGQTISYSELAVKSGNVRASRAVGTAMKNNPFLLMVPCHRVIKKNGSLGHYSGGGVSVKDWLLSYEKDLVH